MNTEFTRLSLTVAWFATSCAYRLNWLVAGSHVFHSADPAATVKEMQQLAENARAMRV